PRLAWFELFQVGGLRVDEQSRRRRKRWPLGFFRQPGNAERAADANRATEDLRGELDQAGELAGAAGQDDAPARLRGERRSREPVANHFEDLLDARPDNADQLRARDELGRLVLVAIDRGYRDHVALVQTASQNAAIERLDSLGVGNACAQSAGDIHGYVVAAARKAVAMHESAAREYRDRGRPRPHVDEGGAEIGLVVGQHGEASSVGARRKRSDLEVTAL